MFFFHPLFIVNLSAFNFTMFIPFYSTVLQQLPGHGLFACRLIWHHAWRPCWADVCTTVPTRGWECLGQLVPNRSNCSQMTHLLPTSTGLIVVQFVSLVYDFVLNPPCFWKYCRKLKRSNFQKSDTTIQYRNKDGQPKFKGSSSLKSSQTYPRRFGKAAPWWLE